MFSSPEINFWNFGKNRNITWCPGISKLSNLSPDTCTLTREQRANTEVFKSILSNTKNTSVKKRGKYCTTSRAPLHWLFQTSAPLQHAGVGIGGWVHPSRGFRSHRLRGHVFQIIFGENMIRLRVVCLF